MSAQATSPQPLHDASPSAVQDEPARRRIARQYSGAFGIGLFLVAVYIFFTLEAANFLTYSNQVIILSGAMVIGVVALGQLFCIVAGTFDFSVGGVVPLGAVCYASFCNDGLPVPVAILLVILIGGTVGVGNGILTSKVGLNPLIATFGMMSVTAGLALQLTNGGTTAIDNEGAGALANVSFQQIPWGVWVLVVLALITAAILRYTSFGRSLYAIGGNPEASWLAGIRVGAWRIVIFVICGSLAAFAGVILASQLLAASGTVGNDAALTSVAAVVLGGASIAGGSGGAAGTMAGVLVLGALANGMALMEISAFYQQIVTGAALLVAVSFARLRTVLAP